MSRVLIAICLMTCALAPFQLFAQKPSDKKAPSPPPAVTEQEPPEEDPSLQPKEYALNPLEAERNITAGNFYFKKGNYRAASRRFLEATKWDPSSAEAFLKLAETEEKLRDLAAARDAYTKYLAAAPEAKNAEAIKKKIAKWPAEPPAK